MASLARGEPGRRSLPIRASSCTKRSLTSRTTFTGRSTTSSTWNTKNDTSGCARSRASIARSTKHVVASSPRNEHSRYSMTCACDRPQIPEPLASTRASTRSRLRRCRSRTRASRASSGSTQKGPMNEPTRLANWDEFVEIFGYTTELVHVRLGLRLLPERRHRLLGRARRAHARRRRRAGRARARGVRRARPDRRLEQAVAQDPRAQRGHVGQHDLVPLRARRRARRRC